MDNVMKITRVAFVAFLLVACVLIAGCGGSSDESDVTPADTPNVTEESTVKIQDVQKGEETITVSTICGDLEYPEQWSGKVNTEVVETEGGCDVKFSAVVGGNSYELFTVRIGGEGAPVGSLSDSNGSVRNVSIEVYDLGDISQLSQEDQDTLYAMQEGVNVLVERLK